MKPSSDPIWRYFKKVLRTEYTFSELIFSKNRSINERYDVLTKKFKEGGELGDFAGSEKIRIFTPIKPTKDEISKILSATGRSTGGSPIEAIAIYLRGIKESSKMGERDKFDKREEVRKINEYVDKNNLWIDVDLSKYGSEGMEQRVYALSDRNVTKLNSGIFYSSWLDYFNSLLLHNYFFPRTSYSLVGFYKLGYLTLPVVDQPFIRATQKTDLDDVEKFMQDMGFKNTKRNDYYNEELGIILEDLHDGNVLTKDGLLYFIDTVFYVKDDKKLKKGTKLNDLGFAAHITLKDVKPEEIRKTGLSKEAFVFLHNWSWSKKFWEDENGKFKMPSIPKEIERELSKFKPTESVVLYRGTKNSCEDEAKRPFKSYTYKQNYAEAVAGIGEYAEEDNKGGNGRVTEEEISPDRIIVDFTKIPHFEDYFTDEVIVKKKNVQYSSGGKILTNELKKQGQRQIEEYIKDGAFLSKEDSPVLAIIPIERFTSDSADIKPSQLYVYRSGVNKWKRRIQQGERPFILIDYSDTWKENRTIDGHHRLTAYKQLGIKNIPVIDRNGKVTKKYKSGAYITPVTPMPGQKIGDYEKGVEKRKKDFEEKKDIAKMILLRKVK